MSLLLDTHVLIWASETPEQLGKLTRALLLDEGQRIFVSAISTLEVARLASLRRLSARADAERTQVTGGGSDRTPTTSSSPSRARASGAEPERA